MPLAAMMKTWMRVGIPQGKFVETIAHVRGARKGGAGRHTSRLAHHCVCNLKDVQESGGITSMPPLAEAGDAQSAVRFLPQRGDWLAD